MIDRQSMIEQSVTDFVKAGLLARGYETPQHFEIVEAFPYTASPEGGVEISRNWIAVGFNSDTDGEAAEMGSALWRRPYIFEFFIFGTSNTFSRNLAQQVKFILEGEWVPLKDLSALGTPEIDQVEVVAATADRQIVPDPLPFQEFVWTTSCTIEDVYDAALT